MLRMDYYDGYRLNKLAIDAIEELMNENSK